jgi:hypothetical protein
MASGLLEIKIQVGVIIRNYLSDDTEINFEKNLYMLNAAVKEILLSLKHGRSWLLSS